jgi:hypothetical protein
MKHLNYIKEELFWRKKKEAKLIEPPTKPKLFGNTFIIEIEADWRKTSSKVDALHNISNIGVNLIHASPEIVNFLQFCFSKMDNITIADNLEKLASDYGCLPTASAYDGWTYKIIFKLNKEETNEFLDLIEKASKGENI